MGIYQGHQLVFKVSNVVACALNSMLSHISTSLNEMNKCIDVDVSNIIHQLSFKHSRTFAISLV